MTTKVTRQLGTAETAVRDLARIGLWGDSRGWVRRWAPSFILGQIAYGFVTQVINVYETWGDFAVASEYFTALLTMMMVAANTGCLVVNSGKIQEILTTMDELRNTHPHDDEGTRLLRRRRRKADKFARLAYYAITCFIIGDFSIIAAACLYKRRIIMRRWFPIDITASPIFELTILVVLLLFILDIYLVLLFDQMTGLLVYELICEFKLLQHRLSHVDLDDYAVTIPTVNKTTERSGNVGNEDPNKNLHNVTVVPLVDIRSVPDPLCNSTETMRKSTVIGDVYQQRLASCVVHHLALIRLVSMLGAALQPTLVVHLMNNFCIGATITLVTIKGGELDLYIIWGITGLGVVTIMEFAVYCYCFTKLTTESSLVGEALYGCSWWEASAPFKRSMNIMQLRINRPLVVYAAGIYPMSMKTYTKVMDTAYSMYNMMLNTS